MKLEHFALNVPDPVAMAQWYCTHLGLRVVRHLPQAAQTHFLADDAGVSIEIYRNPPDNVPDHGSMDPLQMHLAFVSNDPASDAARLIAVGAKLVTDLHTPDGSHLMMLRDPWGISLQLCRRSKALV